MTDAETELEALRGYALNLLIGYGSLEQFCRRACRLRGGKDSEAAKLRGVVWLYRQKRMKPEDVMCWLYEWTRKAEAQQARQRMQQTRRRVWHHKD
jgi:hypothetical protein